MPPYDKSPIASTASLAELSTLLLPLSFIRCYRNYIVNPLALKWQRTDRITLPQGKSIPVSPQRVRPLRKEQALPATILYARLYDGLCLIATQGGPLYVSNTPLRQLLAMQPHLVRLNRWAVVNPSAITNIELQPRPVAIMADGVQISVSKRCLKVLPAHLKNQINHERER